MLDHSMVSAGVKARAKPSGCRGKPSQITLANASRTVMVKVVPTKTSSIGCTPVIWSTTAGVMTFSLLWLRKYLSDHFFLHLVNRIDFVVEPTLLRHRPVHVQGARRVRPPHADNSADYDCEQERRHQARTELPQGALMWLAAAIDSADGPIVPEAQPFHDIRGKSVGFFVWT